MFKSLSKMDWAINAGVGESHDFFDPLTKQTFKFILIIQLLTRSRAVVAIEGA